MLALRNHGPFKQLPDVVFELIAEFRAEIELCGVLAELAADQLYHSTFTCHTQMLESYNRLAGTPMASTAGTMVVLRLLRGNSTDVIAYQLKSRLHLTRDVQEWDVSWKTGIPHVDHNAIVNVFVEFIQQDFLWMKSVLHGLNADYHLTKAEFKVKIVMLHLEKTIQRIVSRIMF